MISQEQKHSLNVNKPQSKAVKLSENAVPGQQWTTKLEEKGEFKMTVMMKAWQGWTSQNPPSSKIL